MRYQKLGNCFEASRLTLGGGGIGQVWGATDRSEAWQLCVLPQIPELTFSIWRLCMDGAKRKALWVRPLPKVE